MTFNGFRNGDTKDDIEQWPRISCSADVDSPIGQYPITLSGGYDENYTLILKNGTFTITQPDAVKDVILNDNNYQIYTVDGKLVKTLKKGVNILRYSDGTTRKVFR